MIISNVFIKKYKHSEYRLWDWFDTDTMHAHLDYDGYEDMSLAYDLIFYRNLYDINGIIEESYSMTC